jgi:hypothetical protein
MGSDRASISTHENGKQHQTQLVEFQKRKRQETIRAEKQHASLEKSIAQMNAAAASSISQDYGLFVGSSATTAGSWSGAPYTFNSSIPQPSAAVTATTNTHSQNKGSIAVTTKSNNAKKEWELRKKQRQEVEEKQRQKRSGQEDTDKSDIEADDMSRKKRFKFIGKNEGFYVSEDGSTTWLEGIVFGNILEMDMPIQVYFGHEQATPAEMRLSENARHWKNAIVVAVRQRPSSTEDDDITAVDRMVVDVAFLVKESEEQIRKSVKLSHIRIRLGDDADDRIPDNLEEARLLAMGGEEVIVKQPENADVAVIDEATGLSSWSTVAIKRTTQRVELKSERENLRAKRRREILEAEKNAKFAEARRMEEAKIANADDSALGAYDIWNRSQEGYKGIKITTSRDDKVEVSDVAKKLADGKKVEFKKTGKKGKPQNRRTTSADDDEK